MIKFINFEIFFIKIVLQNEAIFSQMRENIFLVEYSKSSFRKKWLILYEYHKENAMPTLR